MRGACDGARSHMMRQRIKPASLSALYGLSSQATHEAVHLLIRMLVFDPVRIRMKSTHFPQHNFELLCNPHYSFIAQDKRISVVDALNHPYLDEGRLRYHSCMCKCCYTTSNSMRQFSIDLEPVAPRAFQDSWEKKLTNIQQVKGNTLPLLGVYSGFE